MQKNVAGQEIGAQLVSATDGSAFTGSVTVYVTGDAGTQAVGSVGSGACAHEGNGYHTYAPAQAETNYDLIAFTFTGTGAVPVTVQVYTRVDANVLTAAGTAWNSGAITEASFATTAGSFAPLGIIDQGTAQSATSTTLVLRSAAAFADNVLRNCVVAVYGSTQGYWQAPRLITANALSGDSVTVDPAWEVTPSGTIEYKIYGAPADLSTPPAVNMTQLGGSATPVTNLTTVFSTDFANNYNTTDDAWAVKIKGNISHGGSGTTVNFPTFTTTITGDLTGSVGSVAGNVGGSVNSVVTTVAANVVSVSGDTTAADNLEAAFDGTGGVTITAGLTGNVTGNLSGSVGSVTGAVGSVTGNVGGNVTGSVGSVTSAVTITGDAATAGTRLLTMLELDGSVYRYTINSLEQAPAGGGGGSTDWTSDERTAIRSILGIPASGTTPEDPTAGILDTIRNDTNELQADWADGGRLDLLLDAVLADTGTDGVVLSSSTLNAIADALLDRAAGVEANRTPRQALRLILAAAAGKSSGAGTGTMTYRDTNDTVNRIVATATDGNRTAVTLNAS